MSSKRKRNGETAISLVESALAKCRVNEETFFAHAALKIGPLEGVPLIQAVDHFRQVRKGGIAAVPQYQVPQPVLRLAEEIHNHSGDPRTFFQSFK